VETIINGKHTKPMMLDTGASLVLIPQGLAREIGLTPAATDRSLDLKLADGRTVQAKLMKLDSLQVGKFTAEKVPCAVLPADLSQAPALLGQTFLRLFSYRVNPQTQKLTLKQLEVPTKPPGKEVTPNIDRRRQTPRSSRRR
jgi:aspartyl protease family protein